jgi:hypothetical protein
MTSVQVEKTVIRHRLAHPKGGIQLYDEGNVVMNAFKDFAGKIAKKIAKGQVTDILRTPAPAYVHYPRTYLEGACLDLSYSAKYLTKAAESSDPLERLKNIICMYVGGHYINPTDL